MSRQFYLVFTRPKSGQDAVFNEWYSGRHIFDLVAIPGIVGAQRFRLTDPVTDAATPDYLAIYEFADTELAIGGIAERRGTDRMPSTDAIDREASKGVVFRPTWSVASEWQFGAGELNLVRLESAADVATVQPGVGVLVANERQSRPGPPVFDVANFSAAGSMAIAEANEVKAADRMRARMHPITDRVSASA